MARPKRRSSVIVEKAQTRLAAVKSIDTSLDLGNGISVKSYATLLEDARTKLEKYNTVLSLVDDAYTDMSAAEKALADQTEKVLIAVAYQYGKDSNEYKMAGGIRKSDRKRPDRKVKEDVAIESSVDESK
jgi:hypothetical protein